VKTTILTSFKGLAILLQKAGPYLLLEILLPGGTMFALLLFLVRRAQANGGLAPAGFAGRIVAKLRAVFDLMRSPIGVASVWRGRGRARDGLEALAIAPVT
jgi:hypothetical protein